jgi:hypothetical protein
MCKKVVAGLMGSDLDIELFERVYLNRGRILILVCTKVKRGQPFIVMPTGESSYAYEIRV